TRPNSNAPLNVNPSVSVPPIYSLQRPCIPPHPTTFPIPNSLSKRCSSRSIFCFDPLKRELLPFDPGLKVPHRVRRTLLTDIRNGAKRLLIGCAVCGGVPRRTVYHNL